MKRCPSCERTYRDRVTFCFADGLALSLLESGADGSQASPSETAVTEMRTAPGMGDPLLGAAAGLARSGSFGMDALADMLDITEPGFSLPPGGPVATPPIRPSGTSSAYDLPDSDSAPLDATDENLAPARPLVEVAEEIEDAPMADTTAPMIRPHKIGVPHPAEPVQASVPDPEPIPEEEEPPAAVTSESGEGEQLEAPRELEGVSGEVESELPDHEEVEAEEFTDSASAEELAEDTMPIDPVEPSATTTESMFGSGLGMEDLPPTDEEFFGDEPTFDSVWSDRGLDDVDETEPALGTRRRKTAPVVWIAPAAAALVGMFLLFGGETEEAAPLEPTAVAEPARRFTVPETHQDPLYATKGAGQQVQEDEPEADELDEEIEPSEDPVAAMASEPAASPPPKRAGSPRPTESRKAPPNRKPTTPRASSPRAKRESTPPPADNPWGGATLGAASSNPWGGGGGEVQQSNLSITSTPSGANVYVDGQKKGKTPLTTTVPFGNHTFRVEMSGFTASSRAFDVQSAEMAVPFELRPELMSGQVTIGGRDEGARVFVDGNPAGKIPTVTTLEEGPHRFRVVRNDGSTFTQTRNVRFDAQGGTFTVTLSDQ